MSKRGTPRRTQAKERPPVRPIQRNKESRTTSWWAAYLRRSSAVRTSSSAFHSSSVAISDWAMRTRLSIFS